MQKLTCLVLALCTVLWAATWITSAEGGMMQEPAWANPTAKTLKRVSALPGAQHESNFLNNIDCQLTTYRLINSSEMRSGCFTPTAFGFMDADSGIVIFNGTDEGLPLTPKANGNILVPWPNASTLIALDPVVTGGAYLNLYSSPMGLMEDQRTALLLTSKKMSAPPNIQLKDSAGQRLIINARTLTISDGGSWLVAETYSGSFVRINLATLDTKLFAPAYPTGGLASRVAVSNDGRYVAVQNKNYSHFKVYDLASCAGNTCASYNYHPLLSSQVNSITGVEHLRFINNGLLSFEVNSSTSGQSGVYQLAPRGNIDSMADYIGLGDSYTSGEGAFDYRDGTDTENNSCHLSIHSYPMLLTKHLFTSLGGHSVACSGARINDISNSSGSYKGQMRDSSSLAELTKDSPDLLESVESNYLPGYIAQHRFVKRWQPKVVTVSIGGNDIGFGDILQKCVMPKVSRHHSDNTCFNTYEDRVELRNLIDRTVPRWASSFKQLKSDSAITQIYAIGYPDVIDDTGRCAINVNLGRSELVFAKELLAYLNQKIETAAGEAGVTYVDISDALEGHRLCETASHNVAVNGLTAGRDAFVFGRESYHPNALGQQLIEQAILRQTSNLTSGSSSSSQHTSSLLDAPKSGRAIVSKVPASFTSEIQRSNSSSTIRLSGSLLKPNASYALRIGSQNLGSLTSDAEGNIQSDASIPAIPSGPNTIDIIGNGPTGQPIDVTQPIYVPNSSNDIDGDGILDDLDSCRTVVNSGFDIDQDGIDDICDPLIAEAPITLEEEPTQNPTPQNSTPENTDQSQLPRPETTNTAPNDTPIITPQLVEGVSLGQPRTPIVVSFLVNNTLRETVSMRKEIYHEYGGGVNNGGSQNGVLGTKKSLHQGSNRIRYVSPWVMWWVYLLFIPVVLWGVLRLVLHLSAVG